MPSAYLLLGPSGPTPSGKPDRSKVTVHQQALNTDMPLRSVYHGTYFSITTGNAFAQFHHRQRSKPT